MNLAELKEVAEQRLARALSERALAMLALSGETQKFERMRYLMLCEVPLGEYIRPGDVVELHVSCMPSAGYHEPAYDWKDWSRLTVARVGDCVGFWLKGHGDMSVPAGDFVLAVLHDQVRSPQSDAAERA